jgi:hypothetical protein
MSTIQNDMNELKILTIELKRLSLEIKTIRNSHKIVAQRIIACLTEKKQPGVKYKNTAVILDHKEKRKNISKKEKKDNIISILKRYNIPDVQGVFEEITESVKGAPTEITKLKITNIK